MSGHRETEEHTTTSWNDSMTPDIADESRTIFDEVAFRQQIAFFNALSLGHIYRRKTTAQFRGFGFAMGVVLGIIRV
jgi:hypothetical protein